MRFTPLAGLLSCLILAARTVAADIEVRAADFAGTRYLSPEDRKDVRAKNILRHIGEADYEFRIPADGWYELWMEANGWPTDLFLDGEFLYHGSLVGGPWEVEGKANKVLNLRLKAGDHVLRVCRPYHPGLPYMRRFLLRPAKDVTGMARARPLADRLCFRRGERFAVQVTAGPLSQGGAINIVVRDSAGERVSAHPVKVGAKSMKVETASLPTERQGVFNVDFIDGDGRAVARPLQYLVVDTERPAQTVKELHRELVQDIDCAHQKPDYASDGWRVTEAPWGDYLESGTKGRFGYDRGADFFAYTLDLPSTQAPYLAEIEFPDDDLRVFTIALVEEAMNPRACTQGVTSGGIFSLSRKLQTHAFLFFPRQRDPRLLFQNWYTGQRAAAARIRVYRITGGFPVVRFGRRGRWCGMYQEEPLRFTSYFGGAPEGNTWANLWRCTDRVGRLSNFMGYNFWHPTIAVYQSRLWPGTSIPGYRIADEDGWGVLGPPSTREPMEKDVMRLMLLACEKYGLNFVGELHMPPNAILKRTLDERFGGDGDLSDDGPQKPWLLVSDKGECPTPHGYYNALHPKVQEWVASVVTELANRYHDSPAFQGVALRLMGWQFGGWQALPSIHYGYGDFTIAEFERDSGLRIPVKGDDPERFAKRYQWLMANAYEPWVQWRCRRLTAFYARLAAALTRARPDLRLFINLCRPNLAADADQQERDEKGWRGLVRECGVDTEALTRNPAIVFSDFRPYPPGIRNTEPVAKAAAQDAFFDPAPVEASAKPSDGGAVHAVRFDALSMEGVMVNTDQIGMGQLLMRKRTYVRGAGLLTPAGIHAVARYANAMADGNIVVLCDGSHGYPLGPPWPRRDFMREYRALPAIGMTRLPGTGDPAALWHGQQDGKCYFYLVNRMDEKVTVTVRFQGRPRLRRLVDGAAVTTHTDGRLDILLQPYRLLALVNESGGSPISMEAATPPEVRQRLAAQIRFAAQLLAGEGAARAQTLIPYSLIEHQRAERKLAEAREHLAAGRVWSAQRALRHHHLVRVYEAFGAYPPDLVCRKAPPRPEQAMTPQEIARRLSPSGRRRARIVPALSLAPSLPGEQALTWSEDELLIPAFARWTSRYRVSCGYVVGEDCEALRVKAIDAKAQPRLSTEEHTGWGRTTWLDAVPLRQGEHLLSLRTGGGRAGLLFLDVRAVYHPLLSSDFMVIGPFRSEPRFRGVGSGMSTVYPPERERRWEVHYPGDGGRSIGWQRPAAGDEYVDLYHWTGAYAQRVSYAVTYIQSPEARDAALRFGVDYWARLWLNGEQVFEQLEGHGPPRPAQFHIPVRLRPGVNELLLKVHAGSMGNGFWLSVTDPGDLEVAATQDRLGAR